MNDKTKPSSLFVEHFGKPGNIPPPGDPITVTAMVVEVDRISFFDGNPRRAANEKYLEIKDSIRESGLDNPLLISRRPDDPVGHYLIYKGGNTRLRVLKELWEETKDPRFLKIRCEFHPFVSDTDALIAHMRENELRGGMTFIDRALAVQRAKAQLEVELGETLSLRKLEAALKQRGFPISIGMMSKLEYAANLNPFIPLALQAGLGKLQIERLTKLEKATFTVWKFHGNSNGTDQAFREAVFAPALSSMDGEAWEYEATETAVKDKLLAALPQDAHTATVLGNIKLALDGKELKVPALPPLAAVPSVQQSTLMPATTIPIPDAAEVMQGNRRIEEHPNLGGDALNNANSSDDNGLEDWLPNPPRKEVVVSDGSWLERLKNMRERNYELAVKLANGYVPKGGDSITPLDTGFGFIMHDVFNLDFMTGLLERMYGENAGADPRSRGEAFLAYMHISNLWWFLSEVSTTFVDPDDTGISCPPELLAQYAAQDSDIYNEERLQQIHPHILPATRYRTWWAKLPTKHLEWVFEIIRNACGISMLVMDHGERGDWTGPWEVMTP